MQPRERMIKALRREVSDRIPLFDGFPWPQAEERWRKEGLPEGQSPADALGLDRCGGAWVCANLGFETKTLEENEHYRIEIDANGVTTKVWKDQYATPLQMDFAIKTLADWKKRAEMLDLERFPLEKNVIENSVKARESGDFHFLTIDEPIWFSLRLLGHDNCLERMADEPEFIEDIVERITDFGLRRAARLLDAGGRFDALWLWSDLCYKNGMLYSPALHRRHFLKCHRRIKEWCAGRGLPIIYHCDGNVSEFIPLLIEAGIDCIQPLEARCGNDVRVYKRRYGRDIAFFGNINMDIVAKGDRKEIETEVVSKIEAAKTGGGYIHHSDHSVPPTVSWDNYRFWQKTARRVADY
ncbi:MAG TPA: uroporphyrinogen decarboxylase family protein [Candidatus Brocadiia bacterium]|nr:uroporphyrinogen decarboxylase family protein [Candidatus Brocadiia bacterium]